MAISAWRVVASIVLTVVLATPLGLAIGQSQKWNRRLSALIYLTYPIPKVVFLPIILLFLGIGDASKIFLIWLILFYQVLLVVRDASAGVHPDLVQSVESLGSSRLQLLRYVFFPACLPGDPDRPPGERRDGDRGAVPRRVDRDELGPRLLHHGRGLGQARLRGDVRGGRRDERARPRALRRPRPRRARRLPLDGDPHSRLVNTASFRRQSPL